MKEYIDCSVCRIFEYVNNATKLAKEHDIHVILELNLQNKLNIIGFIILTIHNSNRNRFSDFAQISLKDKTIYNHLDNIWSQQHGRAQWQYL